MGAKIAQIVVVAAIEIVVALVVRKQQLSGTYRKEVNFMGAKIAWIVVVAVVKIVVALVAGKQFLSVFFEGR